MKIKYFCQKTCNDWSNNVSKGCAVYTIYFYWPDYQSSSDDKNILYYISSQTGKANRSDKNNPVEKYVANPWKRHIDIICSIVFYYF